MMVRCNIMCHGDWFVSQVPNTAQALFPDNSICIYSVLFFEQYFWSRIICFNVKKTFSGCCCLRPFVPIDCMPRRNFSPSATCSKYVFRIGTIIWWHEAAFPQLNCQLWSLRQCSIFGTSGSNAVWCWWENFDGYYNICFRFVSCQHIIAWVLARKVYIFSSVTFRRWYYRPFVLWIWFEFCFGCLPFFYFCVFTLFTHAVCWCQFFWGDIPVPLGLWEKTWMGDFFVILKTTF